MTTYQVNPASVDILVIDDIRGPSPSLPRNRSEIIGFVENFWIIQSKRSQIT
jgi:hypothetical protein